MLDKSTNDISSDDDTIKIVDTSSEIDTPEPEVEKTNPEVEKNDMNYENYSMVDIQTIAGVTVTDNNIVSNDTLLPEPQSEAEQAEIDLMKSLGGI